MCVGAKAHNADSVALISRLLQDRQEMRCQGDVADVVDSPEYVSKRVASKN